ncbi:MAG TPA: polyprenyl synthetase family protein, partial [Halothiobacillaceae bacterium]|nr:polyprenyl synthetase family protein [Halothiobacillaceae bacterium]
AYTLAGRGKRLRPALVYLAAGAIKQQPWPSLADEQWQTLLPAGLSVELIHLYSLVHDDLPCMDDDAIRHGRPTLHCAFDQATAVLTGDALQSMAFATLNHATVTDSLKTTWSSVLADSAGIDGMVGGQALDLAMEGQTKTTLDDLSAMHDRKTGALIVASLMLGAHWALANARQLAELQRFGLLAGRAFQIQDDILDATGSTEMLGKTAGKDAKAEKCSYVTLLGLTQAQEHLQQTAEQAHAVLSQLSRQGVATEALALCLDFITQRPR